MQISRQLGSLPSMRVLAQQYLLQMTTALAMSSAKLIPFLGLAPTTSPPQTSRHSPPAQHTRS